MRRGGGRYCPVEVKWTDVPTQSDIRHRFLNFSVLNYLNNGGEIIILLGFCNL